MVSAPLLSLILEGLDALCIDYGLQQDEESLLRSIDFSAVLMQGMLLLLFAGALRVDLSELGAYRCRVGALAVVSTVLSTRAVGFGAWLALPWVGLHLPDPRPAFRRTDLADRPNRRDGHHRSHLGHNGYQFAQGDLSIVEAWRRLLEMVALGMSSPSEHAGAYQTSYS